MSILNKYIKNRPKRPYFDRQKRLTENQFKRVLQQSTSTMVTVVIDWLSINFTCPEDTIQEPEKENTNFTYSVNNDLVLTYSGKGNKHFKYIWSVIYKQTKVAELLSHTRNEKFVKKNNVKIDFKNFLFYNAEVWPVYDFIKDSLGLQYKSTSRIDVAFDGLNYLYEFFNLYFKQTTQNKVVEMKGRSKLRSDVYDRQKMKYESFKMGKGTDTKTVTIYNKSLDIVKTGKEYIQVFWQKNGILKEVLPFTAFGKMPKEEKNEKTYLDGYENIFRFEFRFGSDAIKDIKDFSIDKARDINYLVSMVKMHTRVFFDAIWLDNPRIDRCTPIELIPFDRFNIVPLEKAVIKPQDDIYKAKLSLHLLVKEYYLGKNWPDDAATKQRLEGLIKDYGLETWFNKKFPEWNSEYKHLSKNKETLPDINLFFDEILMCNRININRNEYKSY